MSATYRVEALTSESDSGVQAWVPAPVHYDAPTFASEPASGLGLSAACEQARRPSRHGLARVVNEDTGLALTSAQLLALRGEVQS